MSAKVISEEVFSNGHTSTAELDRTLLVSNALAWIDEPLHKLGMILARWIE